MSDFYTIQDVLGFAIRLEQASQEFYQRLSRTTHSPSISAFLQRLVQEEKLHEEQIRKLLDRQGGISTDPISAHEVDGYVQAIQVPQTLGYKEAVKLALDKEKAAEMLYSVVAGIMNDPALKKMFLKLSDQEKIHKQFFEKEYNRIQISEN